MEKNDLFIPVVLGTGRKDRESEKAAQFVFEEVQRYGVQSELIDVRTMGIKETIPSWVNDAQASKWRGIAGRANGFVFIVPEYNHGYPGELKILIDRAKDEYLHKPVVVCGVSAGGFGGVRMVQNLLPIWVALQMVVVKSSIFFSGIADLFDDNGAITDDSYSERVVGMMDELTWFAETLKSAKDS